MKIILSMVFFALAAQAGPDRVGNGGDAILCSTKAQFLDEYEALSNGEVLDLGSELVVDPFARAAAVIDRLADQMPLRSAQYKEWLESFKDEAQFRSGIQLTDIDDAGLIAIPIGCKIEQVVVQVTGDNVEILGYRYLINKDIWDVMTVSSQTMMLLHELVYREALSTEVNNSLKVRMMNRLLSGAQIDPYQSLKKQKLFQGMYFEVGGFSMETTKYTKVSVLLPTPELLQYSIEDDFSIERKMQSYSVCGWQRLGPPKDKKVPIPRVVYISSGVRLKGSFAYKYSNGSSVSKGYLETTSDVICRDQSIGNFNILGDVTFGKGKPWDYFHHPMFAMGTKLVIDVSKNNFAQKMIIESNIESSYFICDEICNDDITIVIGNFSVTSEAINYRNAKELHLFKDGSLYFYGQNYFNADILSAPVECDSTYYLNSEDSYIKYSCMDTIIKLGTDEFKFNFVIDDGESYCMRYTSSGVDGSFRCIDRQGNSFPDKVTLAEKRLLRSPL